ncbi:hypothetical protein ACFPOI_26310 [Nonomuraea angiospora]|uniref:Uncharacterized protein n=1 Tax=Nonomuraea angiospora TaxID=46172 RepID=A0ABR9LM68_9ACTN|nr:hypothetical protein [Nonomuraea angiospora]MBE1581768.1 hypothetical protein [Nonomuraea angiospora]
MPEGAVPVTRHGTGRSMGPRRSTGRPRQAFRSVGRRRSTDRPRQAFQFVGPCPGAAAVRVLAVEIAARDGHGR